MIGGGQLLRNAVAYAAVLRRAVRIQNVRGGRTPPGLRPGHLAALNASAAFCGAQLAGAAVGSAEVAFDARSAVARAGELVVDAGTGGSTMLMLQALLPSMLARSLAEGKEVEVVFKGGTNVCSPPGKGPFQINAPQVDYTRLVLFPVLRHLFGVHLEMQVRHRGFLQGGGEVLVRAFAPKALCAFELLARGEICAARGAAYRSAGVPKDVLPRMLEGEMKKRPAGAAVVLREQLPEVSVQWDCEECPSAEKSDACGLVVALETTAGCVLGGDSMGRRGTSAESVGEEAAHAALAALATGGCCDEHLEDQLVVFMALARGTSRLRLGKQRSLHLQTALWLAEGFGASVRIVPDPDGDILEVTGML
ncbi:unnamed protein product [Effrenium voratum]|uniref:RNA 3'-terminal-phosphate cyclase (ATP) n=1 Tax=Effrenium voratum TaxID=2562239 RepID=A0AA36N1J2_9DINO|nr:unnamed protein product [Effrenium voratum]CAJ1415222.1 unnamed protein product [Effrenium voratum]